MVLWIIFKHKEFIYRVKEVCTSFLNSDLHCAFLFSKTCKTAGRLLKILMLP